MSRKGFTLIELMVAISIVAILATVGLVMYSNAQKLGRDSRRQQDLRSIATALELYKNVNNTYCVGSCSTNGDADTALAGLATNYISVVPKDPKGASYKVTNTITTYKLQTNMEGTAPGGTGCSADSPNDYCVSSN